MKKLILALTIVFLGGQLSLVAAPFANQIFVQETEEQKVEVNVDELPDKVVESFTESEYSAWQLSKVYKVTNTEDNSVHYQFDLNNDDETKELKISPEGEILKDEAQG